MYKKGHKSSIDVTYSKKDSLHCSVCNSIQKQADLFVCETGHVICENCQRTGEAGNRPDSGDFIAEKSLPPTPGKARKQLSEQTPTKDLASGDHSKRNKISKLRRISKSESKINTVDKDIIVSNKNKKNKTADNLETIIEYKNANFCDSKSSTSSLSSSNSLQNLKNLDTLPNNLKVCPRPITCPILECSKMVAMDSVMLHFHFDHSKVPRKTLISGTPSQLLVKASNISAKTQCLTIFLLSGISVAPTNSATDSGIVNDNVILLMGARMQDPTEMAYSSATIKKKDSSIDEETKLVPKERFDNNEILLLWLCRLENNANTYSITLLKNNKKVGHSYIGEAVHIREQQTTFNMYQKCDCLILRGLAANKLLDEQNQFLLVVNVLD